MIDEQEKHYVIQGMATYGGSFVKALAECIRRADRINLQLIKNTWPKYWEKYHEMGKHFKIKEPQS